MYVYIFKGLILRATHTGTLREEIVRCVGFTNMEYSMEIWMGHGQAWVDGYWADKGSLSYSVHLSVYVQYFA